jgi:Phosphotransferase enzyme family
VEHAVTAHIPDTLDEALSPSWLTSALQSRFPGVEVTAVVPGVVVDRISTNACFRIECADGLPEGLPSDLCVKGYFNEIGQAARFIGESEAYFYRDLVEVTGVRTLRPVYADIDPLTRHGVVITVDIVAEGGVFLDGRTTFTPDQTADSLRELARLHARTWNDTRWSRVPWLAPRMGRVFESWGVEKTVSVIAANLHGPNGDGIPEALRDEHRLVDAYRALIVSAATDVGSAPWCVIHGDPHVGNLFVDAEDRPSLLDWQLVQRGRWSVDVGYHIASVLSVEDRRSAEQDLLRHYLDCLGSFGVQPPAWDNARSALHRGIVLGFFLWAITTKVEPAIIGILLQRLGTAAADSGALNAAERAI